jgi:hypothetical protein
MPKTPIVWFLPLMLSLMAAEWPFRNVGSVHTVSKSLYRKQGFAYHRPPRSSIRLDQACSDPLPS